jgi:hypothetical protein
MRLRSHQPTELPPLLKGGDLGPAQHSFVPALADTGFVDDRRLALCEAAGEACGGAVFLPEIPQRSLNAVYAEVEPCWFALHGGRLPQPMALRLLTLGSTQRAAHLRCQALHGRAPQADRGQQPQQVSGLSKGRCAAR